MYMTKQWTYLFNTANPNITVEALSKRKFSIFFPIVLILVYMHRYYQIEQATIYPTYFIGTLCQQFNCLIVTHEFILFMEPEEWEQNGSTNFFL
jgi:hypothetical protein